MSKEKYLSFRDDEQRNTRKAILKRERKTIERLQEAQQAQAKAQARFEQAQARLHKCAARVERIEGRLVFVREQLVALEQPATIMQTTSDPTSASATEVQSTPAVADEESPPTVSEAHAAAEASEENIRISVERVAVIPVPPEIMQIEEEEVLLEASSAETFAHITAERAAKARVAAELSSKQTHEARLHAQQVEQALVRVQLDIRAGVLSGEDAEIALRMAEREATRAQAMLADAEAAEEQALQAAINTEAAAEVAEGMAYAANDHIELLEDAGEAQELEDLGNEITLSIPIVRPPSEE